MNIKQITTDMVYVSTKNNVLKILIKDEQNPSKSIQFNFKNAIIVDPSNFHICYKDEQNPTQINILWITDDKNALKVIALIKYFKSTLKEISNICLPVVHICEHNHWHNYYNGERISDEIIGQELLVSLNKTNKETGEQNGLY